MESVRQAQQFLTFGLGEEEYAVEVLRVREVLEYTRPTRLPNASVHLCGVINVRGAVVPVIDLRSRLGLPPVERTVDTCIVVLELPLGGDMAVVGAMADSVHEVIDFEEADMEPTPRIGVGEGRELVRSIAKSGERFVMLLDLERLLTEEELQEATAAAAKGEGSPEPPQGAGDG